MKPLRAGIIVRRIWSRKSSKREIIIRGYISFWLGLVTGIYGIWLCLSLVASIVQKFHFLEMRMPSLLTDV